MAEIDELSRGVAQYDQASHSDIAREAHYYVTFGHELVDPARAGATHGKSSGLGTWVGRLARTPLETECDQNADPNASQISKAGHTAEVERLQL